MADTPTGKPAAVSGPPTGSNTGKPTVPLPTVAGDKDTQGSADFAMNAAESGLKPAPESAQASVITWNANVSPRENARQAAEAFRKEAASILESNAKHNASLQQRLISLVQQIDALAAKLQ